MTRAVAEGRAEGGSHALSLGGPEGSRVVEVTGAEVLPREAENLSARDGCRHRGIWAACYGRGGKAGLVLASSLYISRGREMLSQPLGGSTRAP